MRSAVLVVCACAATITTVSCSLPTEPDLVQAYMDTESQVSGTRFLRWAVEVYDLGGGERRHTCGGSLVAPAVVISAARCFWGGAGLLPAAQFAVARTYGGLTAETVWAAVQKSNVSRIDVPASYRDRAGLFADDIAVLRLERPLRGVLPVCISFDVGLERRQLVEGNYGRNMGTLQLAGGGLPSPLFTALEVPSASRARCAAGSEPYFREQLTPDKICAGFKPVPGRQPESLICQEDHGSGLAFYIGSGFAAVPYLRGVASTPFPDPGPLGTVTGCATFRYAAFTRVTSQRAFLEQHIPGAGVEGQCASYYTTAACEANSQCHC